ncbi:MAG: Gfo/Idh/MocA family oxidoreductase [Ruminococcaceae bacterium]|nr:Gfo/Idh/MocA family oxidoreductase [Oscillospiraceae bacterium]
MEKKRYAQVGIGGRARMFYKAIAADFNESSELVAFCDINKTRMEYANEILEKDCGYHKVPMYGAEDFEKMIIETKPDVVIVTSVDRTHHRYIIKAMELGCDVISEKPMTVDSDKCQDIIDCIERTGKKLRVSFNYRYAPHNTKMRDLIMNDTVGKITQVHFEWLLNTSHGADYFRRWHRDKRNSGGLLVHKSTHHFDLVNFWLDTYPKRVFALGDLKFYGRENAEERGVTKFYSRVHGQKNAEGDPFALVLEDNERLKRLYLDAEADDGYIRDQSVFGDNISIEDTMNVLVQYKNGAQMSYSLNAYSPWEGFRVSITGTKGRIEMEVIESVYINAGGDSANEGVVKGKKITVYPMFGEPYNVPIEEAAGGHGGGDAVLLNDLFGIPVEDPYKRAASHIDGAMSILTGIAANKSIASGMPVDVMNLVQIDGLIKK